MERPADGVIEFVDGHGIEGDCHASPIGPRQVLVVAQSTLDAFGITAGALRANVVVEGLALDAAASGSVLALGADARVRLTFRCEVCRVLAPHLSPAQRRAIAGRRGYLGVVVRGGTVRAGDRAALGPPAYEPVPDAVGQRFAWVVQRIPRGRVLTYRDALRLVGAAPGYARALPTYVRRAAEAGAAAHRVVDSAGRLLPALPGQRERLASERVPSAAGAVDLRRHAWLGGWLYRTPR